MDAFLVLAGLAIVVGCSSKPPAQVAAPATTSTNSSTTVPTTPAPTTVPVTEDTSGPPFPPPTQPAGCHASDPKEVALIEPGLTGKAAKLGEAFTETVGARRYVAANIHDAGGQVISHSDAWVIDNLEAYTLSGGARLNSLLKDGRKLPGNPSAGDDIVQHLYLCVQGAPK